ncbi:hypothetical protein RhiirB3_442517 [Rhizophagus irregularis]|nr:hypothetical protein RhiirB3_442517 [Rhizophagus irregularis]
MFNSNQKKVNSSVSLTRVNSSYTSTSPSSTPNEPELIDNFGCNSKVSTDKPVLQAIVESLLPLKYHIPELLLVVNGTKLKSFGHFGYSDIFVLKGIGDNNVSLELKYTSLVNLIKLIEIYKNKFNANDLENLDKIIIEKANEKVLLKRSYSYWSKEYGETTFIKYF